MIEVNICVGSACHLKGSYDVIDKFKYLVNVNRLEDIVIIKAAFCLGKCTNAVSVKLEDEIYSVSPDNAEDFFNENILRRIRK